MCKHFYSLPVSFGCSINICTHTKKYFYLSLSGSDFVGLLFPNENEEKVGMWHIWYFCHPWLPCHFTHTDCWAQTSSTHDQVFATFKYWFLTNRPWNQVGKLLPVYLLYSIAINHCISKAHRASLVHFPFKLISKRSIAEHTLLSHVKIIPLQPL